MKKNVILIPPCTTYGDCLSVIGVIYFLLNYYENIFFYITKERKEVADYYQHFFMYDELYNKRIFISDDITNLVVNTHLSKYDIVNTHTGDWLSAKFDFADLKNVDQYFNDLNPLYNSLEIPEKYQTNPNCHLPNSSLEINHLFYYKLIGLNNLVRMNFFHYSRNKEIENLYLNDILEKHNLRPGDKYNIINCPVDLSENLIHDNGYKTINISNISPFPGYLLSMLENAETISFIEGSNVNFFYHCQYKKIFNFSKEIRFLIWPRNRNWPQYNLDYAWKMMAQPQLQNWNFIYENDNSNRIKC